MTPLTSRPGPRPAHEPGCWVVGHLTIDDVVLPDGRTIMGTVGGASIYAAVGAHLVGNSVGIISRLGSDYPQASAEQLESAGIPSQLVRVPGRALSQWAIYEHDGSRTFLLHPDSGDYADTSPAPADGLDWNVVGALHLAPMPVRFQQPWIEEAATRDIRAITLDPHHASSADDPERVLAMLPSLTAFLPSELEAARLHGHDPEQAADAFVAAGARMAVVKCGADGSILATPDGRWHISACPVDAVDTTGAGDSYCGAFLSAVAAGGDPQHAARLGTVAAALTIQQSGALAALPPDPGRIAELLHTVEVTPATPAHH